MRVKRNCWKIERMIENVKGMDRVSFKAALVVLLRYFIFTSFWAYKIYYVYGFMMLVLLILCIVTVCVTIVCTYFLLNAEDYRW